MASVTTVNCEEVDRLSALERQCDYLSLLLENTITDDFRICPICKNTCEKFLPAGNGTRQDATCPNCESVERHRTLWLFLREQTNLFSGKPIRLLHFAPEECFKEHFLAATSGDYVRSDINPHLGDSVADIQALPFPDEDFDAIICNHVLEHVPDDRKALRELYRVLRPGGWAILLVPLCAKEKTHENDPLINTPELRTKYYGQEGHLRQYGQDYFERVAEAGFNVTVFENIGSGFCPELASRYRLSNCRIPLSTK